MILSSIIPRERVRDRAENRRCGPSSDIIGNEYPWPPQTSAILVLFGWLPLRQRPIDEILLRVPQVQTSWIYSRNILPARSTGSALYVVTVDTNYVHGSSQLLVALQCNRDIATAELLAVQAAFGRSIGHHNLQTIASKSRSVGPSW